MALDTPREREKSARLVKYKSALTPTVREIVERRGVYAFRYSMTNPPFLSRRW